MQKMSRNIVLAAVFSGVAAGCAALDQGSEHRHSAHERPSRIQPDQAKPAVKKAESPAGKSRDYKLDIGYKTVNFTGKPVEAMAINGTIPGPQIEANVGDTLNLKVCNNLKEETSIHWHGVLLPNGQDGVPGVTTPSIKPGQCLDYSYPVTHAGTYWYHSHTGLQEQSGIYAPIVFHPAGGEPEHADADRVLQLSDWTDEKPADVLRHLKADDDYYGLKKKTIQTWAGAFQNGPEAVRNRLKGMGMAMDLADVGYDKFLANGEEKHHMAGLKGGDRVRLRVINSAASSTFDLTTSCGTMTIVAADGMATEPLAVARQRVVVAETFDVMVTVPDEGACEVRATTNSQLKEKDGPLMYASAILGEGALTLAPEVPAPNFYLQSHDHGGHKDHGAAEAHTGHKEMGGDHASMDHGAMDHGSMDHSAMNHDNMDHSGHEGHDMHMHEMEAAPVTMKEYESLRARTPTTLPDSAPWHEVKLRFTGNMETYEWSFDDVPYSKAEPIRVKKGENVRMTLQNETMMAHPFHLHGHFFRVLNGQGDYSPLKHTVNIQPHQSVTIEFNADVPGDWMAHCHILYHGASGMMQVVRTEEGVAPVKQPAPVNPVVYQNLGIPEQAPGHRGHDDNAWFYKGNAGVASHKTDFNFSIRNQNHLFEIEGKFNNNLDPHKLYGDVHASYGYRLTPHFTILGGVKLEQSHGIFTPAGMACGRYKSPFIEAEGCAMTSGEASAVVGNEHQITDRLRFDWQAGVRREHEGNIVPAGKAELHYDLNKNLSIYGGCDAKIRACGGGIRIGF